MPLKKKENKKCILVRIFRDQANLEKAPDAILNFLGSVCNIPIEDCKDFNNFEKVSAELLKKNVINEKPGLLITEVSESRPTFTDNSSRTYVEPDRILFEEELLNENGPTDDQSANLTSKRKLPISKSFEMLSFRDDQDWSSQNYQKNCIDIISRIASDYFVNHQKLINKIERMEKTMGEMSNKLNSLEYLPKILNCLASNQNPLLEKSTPQLVLQKVNQNKEMVESSSESDDEKVKADESFKDVQHRIYFKNLLLSYISSEIPECAKNHGLDKIKIEYPYSIIKLKEIFEKECMIKRVTDWKKMWNYCVNARKKMKKD